MGNKKAPACAGLLIFLLANNIYFKWLLCITALDWYVVVLKSEVWSPLNFEPPIIADHGFAIGSRGIAQKMTQKQNNITGGRTFDHPLFVWLCFTG